jgi:hypothetical protein
MQTPDGPLFTERDSEGFPPFLKPLLESIHSY